MIREKDGYRIVDGYVYNDSRLEFGELPEKVLIPVDRLGEVEQDDGLRLPLDLHRSFAELDQTEEAILRFADKHGTLSDMEWSSRDTGWVMAKVDDGEPCFVEQCSLWYGAIEEMRRAVQLWDAVSHGDAEAFREAHLYWKPEDDSTHTPVYDVGGKLHDNVTYQNLDQKQENEAVEEIERSPDARGLKRNLPVWKNIARMHAEEYKRNSIMSYWYHADQYGKMPERTISNQEALDQKKYAAMVLLTHLVSARLADCRILEVKLSSSDGLEYATRSTLRAEVWMKLAQEMMRTKGQPSVFQRCVVCGENLVRKRKDKNPTCSARCRKALSRKNRRATRAPKD